MFSFARGTAAAATRMACSKRLLAGGTARAQETSKMLFSTTMTSRADKIAVVLSGCGVYDGAEVHESAACLAAISRQGFEPAIFAPDKEQAHVVDHATGQEQQQKRNVASESARIARGAVAPLTELKASSGDIKAVVFPGGFGAAKNLCDFGFKGADMAVDPEVARVLKEFHGAGKPLALCCIAPVVAAKVLGEVKLTMGKKGDKWPYGDAIDAAKSFGANMVEKEVDEVCVDEKNRLVSTPAFMYDGKFHQIQDGVSTMVRALVKLIK